MKISDEMGHLCLVPDLSGKALSFSSLGMMFVVDFFETVFIKWRRIPSIPSLQRVFIMNGYQIFVTFVSASIDVIV